MSGGGDNGAIGAKTLGVILLVGLAVGWVVVAGVAPAITDGPAADDDPEGTTVPEESTTPAPTTEPADDGTPSGADEETATQVDDDTPTRTSTPTTADRYADYEDEVAEAIYRDIEEEREQQGYSQVLYRDGLEAIAVYHSNDMAERGYLAHESPDGETRADRYERFGYDCDEDEAGEVIAKVTWSGEPPHPNSLADRVLRRWMNDERDEAVLFAVTSDRVGVGVEVVDRDGETVAYVTANVC